MRVVVLYEEAPDAAQYAEHAVLCEGVPGGTFRHGAVFGSPLGKPQHAYYAEWEFADEQAFHTGTSSDEFMATARDAQARGFPRPIVEFVSI